MLLSHIVRMCFLIRRLQWTINRSFPAPQLHQLSWPAEAQAPYFMVFVHQGWAAFVLITLTLILQAAGMAALIQWIKAQFPKGIRHLGLFRSAVLVVRFTSLLICLHMLEILLWAWFYRWKCFANLGNSLLLFGGQLFDSRPIRRCFSQTNVANPGPGRKRYRGADVRTLCQLPVCHCDPARRTRGPGTGGAASRLPKRLT